MLSSGVRVYERERERERERLSLLSKRSPRSIISYSAKTLKRWKDYLAKTDQKSDRDVKKTRFNIQRPYSPIMYSGPSPIALLP